MQVHAARARWGSTTGGALSRVGIAARVALEQPPLRAVGALAADLSNGPLVLAARHVAAPVVGVLVRIVAAGGAPLLMAAAGLLLVRELQKGVAFGGGGAWWSRPRGGRRVGGRRRRRRWAR
jgi:hypothetical protein